MCQTLNCDCDERVGTKINSLKFFEELKLFFEEQVSKNIFTEIEEKEPFYIWKNGSKTVKWYAEKWYKCNCCGCLWEFSYPDFPAQGFVRKFPNGFYKPKEIVVDGNVID